MIMYRLRTADGILGEVSRLRGYIPTIRTPLLRKNTPEFVEGAELGADMPQTRDYEFRGQRQTILTAPGPCEVYIYEEVI